MSDNILAPDTVDSLVNATTDNSLSGYALSFWLKVDIRGRTECWNWLASKKPAGYGQVQSPEKRVDYSHRVAFNLIRGRIPPGMFICHSCDNRACVNPYHLFLGTQRDNVRDAMSKNRLVNPPVHFGESNCRNTFSEQEIRKIRELYRNGMSQHAIARLFGRHQGSISNIVLNKTWKYIP